MVKMVAGAWARLAGNQPVNLPVLTLALPQGPLRHLPLALAQGPLRHLPLALLHLPLAPLHLPLALFHLPLAPRSDRQLSHC